LVFLAISSPGQHHDAAPLTEGETASCAQCDSRYEGDNNLTSRCCRTIFHSFAAPKLVQSFALFAWSTSVPGLIQFGQGENAPFSGEHGYGRYSSGIDDQMPKMWPRENGNYAYRFLPVFLRV
jgi:hypothetical protein